MPRRGKGSGAWDLRFPNILLDCLTTQMRVRIKVRRATSPRRVRVAQIVVMIAATTTMMMILVFLALRMSLEKDAGVGGRWGGVEGDLFGHFSALIDDFVASLILFGAVEEEEEKVMDEEEKVVVETPLLFWRKMTPPV